MTILTCFVCGEPGEPGMGSQLVCDNHSEGRVNWHPYEVVRHELPANVIWDGGMLPAIDFTDPDAMSSPA